MKFIEAYPHTFYKDSFNEKDVENDYFSFQKSIKSLSNEFNEFELEVFISAWVQRSGEHLTLDSNFNGMGQYLYYDIRMTNNSGFTYFATVSTDVNFHMHSLNLNLVQTTVGMPIDNCIDIYNKILIDNGSQNRIVCIWNKNNSKTKYIALIPQTEIYKLYETDLYYIWGVWRETSINWKKISRLIKTLSDTDIISKWDLEETEKIFKQQSYWNELFGLMTHLTNKIIYADFTLYGDNSSGNVINDYVKDLIKLTNYEVNFEEIEERYDEDNETEISKFKIKGQWFDFSLKNDNREEEAEVLLARKFNSVLSEINSEGKIYQLVENNCVAYIYLTEKQKIIFEKSALFEVVNCSD